MRPADRTGTNAVPPEAPQLVFDYVGGNYALDIGTMSSEADTTLQVTTPSGDILCDDDSGADGDALVTLDYPESGQYEIRVGTYYFVEIGSRSDVFVTELTDGSSVLSERASWSPAITSSRTGTSLIVPPAA